MTYDPGYGNQQQPGNPQSPFTPDPSPVPDVSQPVSGFPPPAPYGQPPAGQPPAGQPPMSGPPMSGPPVSGPGVSGPPASPPYGGPAAYPAYPGSGYPQGQVPAQVSPGQRPQLVTIAVVLTFVGIALAFLGTVLTHLFWSEVLARAGQGATVEVAESFQSIAGTFTFITAGVNLFAAVGASICAIFAMRGSNGARITLCVLCGLFAGWKLMCGGYWLVGVFQTTSDEDLREIQDAVPFMYAAIAIDFVLMLVAIAIVALLLVGPSNRYFNPPKVMATPVY